MKPMKLQYSIYEAKARLSEVIRTVKQQRHVVITERGVPVAKVVPVEPPAANLAERIRELESAGAIEAPRGGVEAIRTIAKRPGGLKRFLATRD